MNNQYHFSYRIFNAEQKATPKRKGTSDLPDQHARIDYTYMDVDKSVLFLNIQARLIQLSKHRCWRPTLAFSRTRLPFENSYHISFGWLYSDLPFSLRQWVVQIRWMSRRGGPWADTGTARGRSWTGTAGTPWSSPPRRTRNWSDNTALHVLIHSGYNQY